MLFRVRRGGTPGARRGSAATTEGRSDDQPDPELVEVSLDRGDGQFPQDLGDFLFLARSSQPGSIGDELQRQGVRVFPQEAFADEGDEHDAYSWVGGTPLPRGASMVDLPRDGEGRVRLVLWDPCGETKIIVFV